MGVVYLLHGLKFVTAELTMKRVNIFFAFFMVNISSVYSLGSRLLFTSMEIKLVLCWYF